jgi:hypothetical protein
MRVEIFSVAKVTRAETLWNQRVNRYADQFGTCVTKHFRGTGIRFADYALGVGDENRVGRDRKVVFERKPGEFGPVLPGQSRRTRFRGIRNVRHGRLTLPQVTRFQQQKASREIYAGIAEASEEACGRVPSKKNRPPFSAGAKLPWFSRVARAWLAALRRGGR